MQHRRCISAILMSFVLFLQPVYAVPPEENQPENSQENNTENEKRQQEDLKRAFFGYEIKKQDKMQECLQKYIAMSIIKQRLKEEKYA